MQMKLFILCDVEFTESPPSDSASMAQDTSRNNDRRGFVYLVRNRDSGHVKIGWTRRHPDERMQEIQTSQDDELQLEGCVPATPTLESNLHRYFRSMHVRGEWFDLSDKMIQRVLDRSWREAHDLHREDTQTSPPPWEEAGVESEEDWHLWQEAGYPSDDSWKELRL